MPFILFSAFGSDFSVTDFVSEHGIKPSSVWRKGQPLRSGRFHKDAGFSLNFDEARTPKEVVPLVETFITRNQDWLVALRGQSVEMVIHLGLTVGEDNSYAPCLEFGHSFLKMLVDENIDLHVSAYPTSDQE